MTEIYTLYSSSKGNSTFFSDGHTAILIDAGRSYKCLCDNLYAIGHSIGDIGAVFITHEHADHIQSLGMISKKTGIPIHITSRCASSGKFDRLSNICVHPTEFCEDIGTIHVQSFPTPHDSCGSVGYTVTMNGERYGLATDIGKMTDCIYQHICRCNSLIIESNHDVTMLINGVYPQKIKNRILSDRGHLSNDACATLLPSLARCGVKNFMLAHLSEDNNTPDIALDSARHALSECCGVTVKVAHPRVPTEFIKETT